MRRLIYEEINHYIVDHLSETDIEKLKEYTKKYEDALRILKTSYSRNEWEKLETIKKTMHAEASALGGSILFVGKVNISIKA